MKEIWEETIKFYKHYGWFVAVPIFSVVMIVLITLFYGLILVLLFYVAKLLLVYPIQTILWTVGIIFAIWFSVAVMILTHKEVYDD